MKMFLGEYDHSLDERGRITLPKKIRQELVENEIVLSRGFDACIFGFDIMRWGMEAEKHLAQPITDDEARKVRRYMFSAAVKADVDRMGRILLPAQLKEYAHILSQVKIIGAGDHFEIWDNRRWNEYVQTFAR